MKKLLLIISITFLFCQVSGQDIIESNNRFAFDIYKILGKTEQNVIFSPASITSAMSMAYSGAKNDTYNEIANTFHFNKNLNEFNKSYTNLIENYSDKKSTVSLFNANSLWIQDGLKLKDEFINNNEKYYSSSAFLTNFIKDSENSRKTINTWVEKNTNNKIKNLIKPSAIDNSTRLILVNALYFKGSWNTKFKKENNSNNDFQIAKKEFVKTVFMNNSFNSWYYKDKYCEIIDIPYSNEQLSLLVILPKSFKKLKKVEKKLNYEYYKSYTERRSKKQINLSIPKFNIESEFDLNKTLNQLGIKEAFTVNANFSGLTETEKLYISKVIHKANIDIDEDGTEASAATAIFMRKTAILVESVDFKVNRPFIYMIRNQKTNTIYFTGKVINPNL